MWGDIGVEASIGEKMPAVFGSYGDGYEGSQLMSYRHLQKPL